MSKYIRYNKEPSLFAVCLNIASCYGSIFQTVLYTINKFVCILIVNKHQTKYNLLFSKDSKYTLHKSALSAMPTIVDNFHVDFWLKLKPPQTGLYMGFHIGDKHDIHDRW